ncbi:MAG: hypothetical protein WCT42_03390 [Candidatus Paceibacterota bacterium]
MKILIPVPIEYPRIEYIKTFNYYVKQVFLFLIKIIPAIKKFIKQIYSGFVSFLKILIV